MFGASQILFVILPLLSSSLHVFLGEDSKKESQIAKRFLQHFLFIGVGVQGLATAYMQTFEPESISKFLDWQSSGLLLEVAKANFAFGLLGILTIWFRGNFWVATGLGYSIFLLTKFISHVSDQGSFLALQPAFYSDFCIPFFILTLLGSSALFSFREKHSPGEESSSGDESEGSDS
ncbi:MAG: hypothetical protein GWP59_01880 [Chlamydiales bacterium]|nr:hypothetical protein [Chlamydiales bacterium]